MGSMEKAIKTGFICRLCSEMNKIVIHIYSDLGLKLKLAKRIHEHLPVTVSITDPLPKTVCWKCIARLEEQHKLVQRIKYARQQLLTKKKASTNETEETESARETPNTPSNSGSTIRNLRVRKRPHAENDPQPSKHNLRRPRK